MIFYELEGGKFIQVYIYSPGSYHIREVTKDMTSGEDIPRFFFKDKSENFIYTIDKANKVIKITNQNGDAVDVHKLL